MKLNQISAGDELTQLVVKKMTERANVLLFAEFYSIFGNAEYARKTATASGGKFRAIRHMSAEVTTSVQSAHRSF